MAKKAKAIYEPGELHRVREKLGEIDVNEARRVARILGGEVGTEKSHPDYLSSGRNSGRPKQEVVDLTLAGRKDRGRPRRAVETVLADDGARHRQSADDPADDPDVHLATPYLERLKMDRFAAQVDFEIKNSIQVLASVFSFLGSREYVSPRFTCRRMNLYYNKIGQLVTSTRILLPRNDARRNDRLKKASPYIYGILDTIRQWNIERIGGDLAKLQSHPRTVRVPDYADLLKAIYRPMFVLEKLGADVHIKGAYKLLYKLLYIEHPADPRDKVQNLVRSALSAYSDIFREVHYGLYPLLMKFISDRWLPYGSLFRARRRRFMAFLDVSEADQIKPLDINIEQIEQGSLEALQEEIRKEEASSLGIVEEEDPDDPEVIARKAREAAEAAERKALEQSLKVLESLFPKAGWERLDEYPDLYPYFVSIYGLRRGYEQIAPGDPLHQIAVLMHIIEDLCSALRYVSFGMVPGSDGNGLILNDLMGKIINNWRRYIDESFTKEYLPRLSEYCRILEHSSESRTSPYAKRAVNDLRWAKRLYFLPYYKFESMGPPPFQKREVTAIYSEIRTFRRYLTMIASNIEQWTQSGGASAKLPCPGLENPLAAYSFDITNPVSKRMDLLLGPSKRNNVHLIFFTLAAVTVLDCLVNSESSWAYDRQIPPHLFRSVDGEGAVPMFGVDEKIDADRIFKDVLRQSKIKQQQSPAK
ncbi:MAG: hypothetical protein FWB79_04980 [Treponema sp.]|nr:hypothetical protein [Treponema sp.]